MQGKKIVFGNHYSELCSLLSISQSLAKPKISYNFLSWLRRGLSYLKSIHLGALTFPQILVHLCSLIEQSSDSDSAVMIWGLIHKD